MFNLKGIEHELANNTHSDKSHIIIEGNKDNKVILTAPYNKSRMIKSKVKQGEFRTAFIGKEISELEKCHFMYKTSNDSNDISFSKELAEHIKKSNIEFLLDLHISNSKRNHDIELGTNFGFNIDIGHIYNIERLLSSKYENVIIDSIFAASGKANRSNVISKACNINCLQLGINWELMNSEVKVKELIRVLSNVVKLLNEKW